MSYAREVDAQRLLMGDALAAQQRLDHADANPASVPGDFNWHGFAEGAAANAQRAVALSDADAWAAISVRAYERLAAPASDAATRSFELSAMHLRAWMIRSHGASHGHPVRDVQRLVDWFRRNIPMPLEQAELEASQLRALPAERLSEHIDRMRTLRALKNRIGVFRTLDEPPDEVRPWVSLWPLLP
jgi:hypothetical protein